jgi:prepilin-type N-terminal cleavage/methylation domain-containing protein
MIAKSQELRVKRREPRDCGAVGDGVRSGCGEIAMTDVADCSLPALDSRLSALDSPRGLTLIELLVTISIIATLSAMFLGASRAAMEHSRGARTKTTIDKLHTLIMERYADYETRRVDLDKYAYPSDLGTQPNTKSVERLVASLPATKAPNVSF